MFGAPYGRVDPSVAGLFKFYENEYTGTLKRAPEPEYKGWPAAGRPERFVRVPTAP